MEQPQLGKKILELRKANGLTQEELVARCNINVRTIQRIEAGEVTPRGHTIRSIFAALDIDLDQLRSKPSIPKVSKKEAQWIILAFISGLMYFLLAFWEGFMDYQLTVSMDADISPWEYTLVKLGILLFYASFMLGFYKMGHIWGNSWIKPASLLGIAGIVICIVADLYLFHINDTNAMAVMAGEAIVFGSIYIVFGYGLVNYQKEFGNMALAAGIVAILTGLAFISVVFALLGLMLLAVSEVLALVILYRAYDKIRNQ
ncbi:hypothetical protein ADICYQ_3643 [Cyclobacterium qasimii M12-11B]|nr:hypothetical protein ADICYQ_3643 [Cyclobacterium qasimii M12-11B]